MTVDRSLLERALARAARRGGEFAEVFVEERSSRSLALEDAAVDQVTGGRQRGLGIRVVRGPTSAFAFTEDLSERGVLAAADGAADALAGAGADRDVHVDLVERRDQDPSPVKRPPGDLEVAAKAVLLGRADAAARAVDPHITQVTAVYFESHHRIQVANTEGLLTQGERCRVRLRAQAIATRPGRHRQGFGSYGPGETGGMEVLDRLPAPEEIGREAARQALALLDARPALSGRVPLVIANGVGGVLFHEACGHGLEADVLVHPQAVYAGKLGQLVASPLVTAVDDATVPRAWGSAAFDDEGTPSQRTVLIEEGRLAGYMYDAFGARRDGRRPTGNGRRASFRHLPIPRMSNTFILAGEHDPADIVAATPHGVYARNFSGGVVDMVTGTFTFNIREGYLIEDGRIQEPLAEMAVVGNGPDVLARVDMVGNDLELAPVICGKEGQKAMASVGQPTLRISEVTVGGAVKQRQGAIA